MAAIRELWILIFSTLCVILVLTVVIKMDFKPLSTAEKNNSIELKVKINAKLQK